MRLINADEVEKYLWDYIDGYEIPGVLEAISKMPTVEPVRKTGNWIDNETSYSDDVPQTCTCSVCGIRSRRPIGNFCKWCGADMR